MHPATADDHFHPARTVLGHESLQALHFRSEDCGASRRVEPRGVMVGQPVERRPGHLVTSLSPLGCCGSFAFGGRKAPASARTNVQVVIAEGLAHRVPGSVT